MQFTVHTFFRPEVLCTRNSMNMTRNQQSRIADRTTVLVDNSAEMADELIPPAGAIDRIKLGLG